MWEFLLVWVISWHHLLLMIFVIFNHFQLGARVDVHSRFWNPFGACVTHCSGTDASAHQSYKKKTMKSPSWFSSQNTNICAAKQLTEDQPSKHKGPNIWALLRPWKWADIVWEIFEWGHETKKIPVRSAMMLPKHVSSRVSCAWRIRADKSAAFPPSTGRSKPAGAMHISGLP